MTRLQTALLSAFIFIAYGIFSQKIIFIGLGLVFGLIALKEYFDKKAR